MAQGKGGRSGGPKGKSGGPKSRAGGRKPGSPGAGKAPARAGGKPTFPKRPPREALGEGPRVRRSPRPVEADFERDDRPKGPRRARGSLMGGRIERSFDDAPRRSVDDEFDRTFDDSPRRGGDDFSFGERDLQAPRPRKTRAAVVEDKPKLTRSGRPVREPRQPRPALPPDAPTRRELRAVSTETLQTGVQTLTVTADENDMRLDRFLNARFPVLTFTYIQRITRKGEVRVNGKRADGKDRVEEGQSVRVPPLKFEATAPRRANPRADEDTRHFLQSITLYEDADVLVLNKPAGLAVQGGSGTVKHVDGLLAALTDDKGEKPRLVHRLDKDTSGCLLVAKSRYAASQLSRTFRSRAARKIYWAVVQGVPKPKQGRVSTFIAKEEMEGESRMKVARHGDDGASHAVSYYAVVDTMAQKLAWLSMKPVTGRTHQLRVHAAEIRHPIIGDPKYFNTENWELPGGIQNKLHLHARRLVVPHPRGQGTIDISAPLPPHMEQTFNLVGWDVSRFDPIVEAPEE